MAGKLWVGTRKGLMRWECHRGQWSIQKTDFLGAHVTMVCASEQSDTVYACLKHGHFGAKVHRSDDGGQTWKEIATPTYPPKPDDVPDIIDPIRNKPIPWSLDMIWAMEGAHQSRLWCGTLPGGLFSSDDRGESWKLNMPLWNCPNRKHWFGGGYDLPGIHSLCIDPNDTNIVTLAISCGGVWQTRDGGNTWNVRANGMRAEYMPPDQAFNPDIQDPHRMVQCRSRPDVFWVQHHNGIFRTTNGCQDWVEFPNVKPSGFGFAVAVHPKNPDMAWFVPACKDADRYPVDGQFVVTRTSDGGQSFDILRQGLPQQHAYHLVYRHALEIDSEGHWLSMGSTTGGLWASSDLGDHWQCLSQDLPPIYCLRMA